MAEQLEMFPTADRERSEPKTHQQQMADLARVRERNAERDPQSLVSKRRVFMRAGARRAE